MSHLPGEPIKGVLHSTDASGGVLVPIYNAGSNAARTLAANEYIEIESVEVIAVVTGDVSVFLSTDSTQDTGETVLRATVAANSGMVMSRKRTTGKVAQNVFVIAPAGVVDVNFSGSIRRENINDTRPAWKESLIPGH